MRNDGWLKRSGPAALRQPSPHQSHCSELTIVVVVAITVVAITVVPITIVAAMFAADVMAMDPMVPVLGPMTRSPSHFPIVVPVTGAVAVKRPITDFDSEILRLDGSRQSKAHRDHCEEQECFLDHICVIRMRREKRLRPR
jgi:hypothetical protein